MQREHQAPAGGTLRPVRTLHDPRVPRLDDPRAQPSASRWMLDVAVWVHRERVLRRTAAR
jgi:hypothetical protein